MAITLVNLSGFSWGVPSDETGINVRRFSRSIEPEFKTFVQDKQNQARGFAIAPTKVTVTVEGEVTGATGVMSATIASGGYTPANSLSFFGAPSTTLFLDRGTVEDKRDGFRDVTAELSAYGGIP